MCQKVTRRKNCPTGYIAHLRTNCGYRQATPIYCKSILCRECEKRRAIEAQERWYEVLAQYKHLSMMTLTVKGDSKLEKQLALLDSAFRKLLDYRLGQRNRAIILNNVKAELESLFKQGKDKDKLNKWQRSTEAFLTMCEKKEKEEGKSFKFRKLLEGLSSLEVTYNTSADLWHSHRHLILSMPFIPEIVLSVIWQIVTDQAGKIVDIRTVKDLKEGLKETIKYTTKAWEIPQEKEEELIKAMRNKKRLWPIGRIKPIKPPPKPCPYCKSTDCDCTKVVMLENDTEEAILNNALYLARLPDNTKTPVLIAISTHPQTKGKTWEAIEVSRDSLSLYQPKYQVNGQPISALKTPSEVITSKSEPLKVDIPPPRPNNQVQTDKVETYNPQLQLWS